MIKLQKFTAFTVINVCVFLFIYPTNINAQFLDKFSINTIVANETSGEKPQSKIWRHDAKWWAVFPVNVEGEDPSGTYLWYLDGNIWTKKLFLSSDNNTQADCKAVGDVTHIFLYSGISSELVSVEYLIGSNTYQAWSTRISNVAITLSSGVETATIDIDSNGRMWLAYESSGNINVQWSNSPYSDWTNSVIVLASGGAPDDICAVTSFGGNKIGIMWSNQTANPNKFGFRYRDDSTSEPSENDFNPDEVPASQSELNLSTGNGMADDHINFAVGSDGSIYVAIKTAYDKDGEPLVALLVRRPTFVSGSNHWEDLHSVRVQAGGNREPTRPIALLDSDNDRVYVVYTQDVGGDDIMYKYSSITNISFPAGDGTNLIPNTIHDWDDAASTKQNFSSEVVILASDKSDDTWTGVMASTGPLPVELAFFAGTLNGNNVELRWRTETEVNNYGFYIERAIENSHWLALGFVEGHGNSNSPKQYTFIDSEIYESANYYYRLKQIDNDGTFEYSDVVTVTVGVPVLFALSQNYPNPFNPETIINYTLPEQQNVSLKVYNMLGELVKELVNEVKPAGTYTVTFDGSSAAGGLPSGIYVYRIQTER
ncbi:MAG: T9SS type A sorting domain-containing protein, partial [Bacteroidetes bacterium]|nr:T9SS type A sorting domain-containing protein [Bacteroidota bacterium]